MTSQLVRSARLGPSMFYDVRSRFLRGPIERSARNRWLAERRAAYEPDSSTNGTLKMKASCCPTGSKEEPAIVKRPQGTRQCQGQCQTLSFKRFNEFGLIVCRLFLPAATWMGAAGTKDVNHLHLEIIGGRWFVRRFGWRQKMMTNEWNLNRSINDRIQVTTWPYRTFHRWKRKRCWPELWAG